MSRIVQSLLLAIATLSVACGGSGGPQPGPPGGSGNLTAGFMPDQPSPGPLEIAMAEGQQTADTVVVEVRVTGTNNILGAAFDVTYDPSAVSFMSHTPGTLLEQGGAAVSYAVSAQTPGRLVVSAARLSGGTVNSSGTAPLMRLTFRVDDVGLSSLGFLSPDLQDGQQPPQDIPGLSWFGGTLTGN